MKGLLSKILAYIGVAIIVLAVFPFMLLHTILKSIWIIFGATIIAFIILVLLGGTMEECFKYSSALGLFVGVGLKLLEKEKE